MYRKTPGKFAVLSPTSIQRSKYIKITGQRPLTLNGLQPDTSKDLVIGSLRGLGFRALN